MLALLILGASSSMVYGMELPDEDNHIEEIVVPKVNEVVLKDIENNNNNLNMLHNNEDSLQQPSFQFDDEKKTEATGWMKYATPVNIGAVSCVVISTATLAYLYKTGKLQKWCSKIFGKKNDSAPAA